MKFKILATLALVAASAGLSACGDDTDVVQNNTVVVENDNGANAVDTNEIDNDLR
jgi:hypothetical protein